MKVFPSVIFFYSILITVVPSVGQDLNESPQQSITSRHLTAGPESEVLNAGLLRIQREMSQIAQVMEAIDSQLTQALAKDSLSGTFTAIPGVHHLINESSPGATVKIFLNSSRSEVKWEACLKASKLYRGLLEKLFEMTKARAAGKETTRNPLPVADDSSGVARLAFLARVIADLEMRHMDLEFGLNPVPNPKQQELWRQLRKALENDDRTYLEKLTALLAMQGVSPHQFAAKVVSDALKTSQSSAAAIIQALRIVNPEEDTWKLAEIPGMNPAFLSAIDCERRIMKDFIATSSTSALVRACDCRKSPDGEPIMAFAQKPAEQAPSTNLNGKTLTLDGLPLDSATVRLSSKDLTQDPLTSDDGKSPVETKPDQSDTQNATFGVTNSSVPRPKIPSWWIRCACPEDHPDAGLVVDGVRWHAPVLQCPNPELKLRELMK